MHELGVAEQQQQELGGGRSEVECVSISGSTTNAGVIQILGAPPLGPD